MTVHEEFRTRKMGGKVFSQDPKLKKQDIIAAMDDIWPSGGPFQIKGPSADHFSKDQTKSEVADVLVDRVPNTGYGRRWLVRKQDGEARLVIVKKAIADQTTEGEKILQVALDQLGDDYNWADAGPDRFDCSGLTLFCHRFVDILLPHSAYMQYHDPRVVNFSDPKKLKDGDLVFYDASPRVPVPNHVGIVNAPGMVVDASTSYDMVVHRPIGSNTIYGYGRIQSVNGPL